MPWYRQAVMLAISTCSMPSSNRQSSSAFLKFNAQVLSWKKKYEDWRGESAFQQATRATHDIILSLLFTEVEKKTEWRTVSLGLFAGRRTEKFPAFYNFFSISSFLTAFCLLLISSFPLFHAFILISGIIIWISYILYYRYHHTRFEFEILKRRQLESSGK